MALPIFQSPIKELTQMQTVWASALNPLLGGSSSAGNASMSATPLLAVKSTSFITSTTSTAITGWDATSLPPEFNPGIGVYTASMPGIYLVTGIWSIFNSNQDQFIDVFKNGSLIGRGTSSGAPSRFSSPQITMLVQLATGDTLALGALEVSFGGGTTVASPDLTRFHLVKVA